MNCDGVVNLLSAYLDGELSPGELLRVEEHLRRCHACADEVDSLRQTVALVASLEEVEVPASFQLSLHERLVALGPPPAAIRHASAARAGQRNVRRWAVPAAAAAAVAALAIGVSQYPLTGQLAGGLKAQTGIVNLADQTQGQNQTASGQNTTPPPLATNTQTKDPVNTGTSAGNTTGNSKDVGPVVVDPPKAAEPGRLDGSGGSKTAGTGTGTDALPKSNLTPQMAYSFTYTVAGTLDPKLQETLWYEYPVHELVNNDVVTIKVPATQEQIDKTQKTLAELCPGAVAKPTSQNLAAELQGAQLAVDQALKVKSDDEMLKASAEQLAADQSAIDQAQAVLKLLQSRVNTAVFTIQFQPAH